MKTAKLTALFVFALFFAACRGVSGSRWFSGSTELTFEDFNWMIFDAVGKTGEKGTFTEEEGYLSLRVEEEYVGESWIAKSEPFAEYKITINGHKLYVDKQDGKGLIVFLKE